MHIRVGIIFLIVFITASISRANHLSPQISPSPSPQPIVALTDERCPNSSTTICHDLNNLTACLSISSSGASKGLFLLVQNDGEEPLKVNVVISDINITFPEIQVSRQQSRKIKILAYVEGSPSIILNAGYGKCIIPIGSEGRYSQFYKQYVIYLSPIHGVYLLFFTILIAGGAWACCKIGKNEQHTDGIRYQELEMEQPPSHSTNDEEMAGGWNQDWDDEWGEEHEVKPPNGHQTENVSGNGHNSKTSDTNGWGNDWDD
ncbi:uncharacterized protein LOC8288965 isoform X1 [Ricinus communis]|uniref:uncharacterized protein LOC8288965 isoform X1 n=1 Tax=Ricinus communis TaxID=3988 RepID=UPI000772A5B7|nr:uncharacterized protein LOC8288965 isoform X1 [Ricinus communis]|eukprot:XP_015575763.1 uncharacterized protein LOC8288965 [Ricinus communis]